MMLCCCAVSSLPTLGAHILPELCRNNASVHASLGWIALLPNGDGAATAATAGNPPSRSRHRQASHAGWHSRKPFRCTCLLALYLPACGSRSADGTRGILCVLVISDKCMRLLGPRLLSWLLLLLRCRRCVAAYLSHVASAAPPMWDLRRPGPCLIADPSCALGCAIPVSLCSQLDGGAGAVSRLAVSLSCMPLFIAAGAPRPACSLSPTVPPASPPPRSRPLCLRFHRTSRSRPPCHPTRLSRPRAPPLSCSATWWSSGT